MQQTVEQLFSEAGSANPYPFYHRLRERAPVCRTPLGSWLVTRYDDAISLLESKALDHWGQGDGFGDDALSQALRALGPNTAQPCRTTVIAAVSATSKKAELNTIAQRIFDLCAPGTMDAMSGLIHPFTYSATCCLLGIDDTQAQRLSTALAPLDGGYLSCIGGGDETCCNELRRQLASIIGGMRGGLLSQLARWFEERGLTESQLIDMVLLLIYASHHNMQSFLGNALLALSAHPERCAELRNGIAANHIHELLRFDSPLQYLMLVAKDGIEIRGADIRPGEIVMVGIGAANRDPAVFENPDSLNFNRPAYKHLSFGHGPFRCIGAQFAEVQARIFLNVFLSRIGSFRLAAPLKWRQSPIVQRGLHQLNLDLAFI